MNREDIERNDRAFFGEKQLIRWYCPICELYGYGNRCKMCGAVMEPVRQLTEEEAEEKRMKRLSRVIAFGSASELLEEEDDPEKNV